MKRDHTQWIAYLKSSDEMYLDFLSFMKGRRDFYLNTYDSSADIKEIHRAQGARAELSLIERFLTEEERENHARAEHKSRVR